MNKSVINPINFDVISIDSTKEDNSWIWNDVHPLGSAFLSNPTSIRIVLSQLRNQGFLSMNTIGHVSVNTSFDWIEVLERHTLRPIIIIQEHDKSQKSS